jgi:glycosyltransferase involved in cell wall biosynthesis
MKKIAIVYDWFDKWGGVERILLILHEIFPNAIFYTSYFDQNKALWARNLRVKTSFIQQLPAIIKRSRLFSLPFYPIAFETHDFSGYDLVISVTSSFAKGIITRPKTYHLCYLLTPTRFLWIDPKAYGIFSLKKIIFSPYLSYLKKWDWVAAQRPDKVVSISKTVADRCQRVYQRESKVIYPPFDINYWEKIKTKVKNKKLTINISNDSYFLVVSRLEPYKRVDLVVKAFNKLRRPLLIIVGTGSQENYLKSIGKKNIHFFSNLTDEQLAILYSKAEGLIMPQEEDFGYVALEAQFFGCPVIAYKKGGATETIIEKKTGIFFDSQTVDSLMTALETFQAISYNLKKIISKFALLNIQQFSKDKFKRDFKYLII